eukprot:jgi/Chlat1/9211/Chrsp97S08469
MADQRLLARVLSLLLVLAAVALPLVAAHNGVIHSDEQSATADDVQSPGSSDSSAAAQDLRSNGHLVANKVGAMVVIFFVPFLGAFLPYFFTFASWLIIYGMLFAGGLFFTLAMMHLIGDSNEGLQSLSDSPYPWAYLLVIVGYLAAFLADIVVHMIMDKRKENQVANGATEALFSKQPAIPGAIVSQHSAHTPSAPVSKDIESGKNAPEMCTRCPANCSCPADNCPCPIEAHDGASMDKVVGTGTDLEKPYLLTGNALNLSVTDAVLLVFALCFHAVFEGLAIGVSATVSDTWSTAGTILIHKFFEGVALGVTILAVTQRFMLSKLAFYAFCFGITAPVGIAIGIIIDRTTTGRDGLWASSILNGIAAGVFIFVALNHIIMKAFKRVCSDSKYEPLAKYAALFMGCTTMALIQIRQD